METFIFCLNAVIPSFLLIALGHIIARKGWLDDGSIRVLYQLSFRLLLPAMVFKAAYRSSLSESFDPLMVGIIIVMQVVSAAIMIPISVRLTDSRAQMGSMIQGASRANTTILGIPLVLSLAGEAGVAPMAIVVAICIPVANVLAVLVLSVYSEHSSQQTNWKSVGLSLLTNPMIIASAVGITLSLLGVRLPSIIERPIFDLASSTLGLTMLLLGAQLDFSSAMRHLRMSAAAVAVRLLVTPLLGTATALALGYRGATLCVLFIALAAPTATASVPFADSMGADSTLAAEIVAFSTAASVVTIFLGSYVLKYLALI